MIRREGHVVVRRAQSVDSHEIEVVATTRCVLAPKGSELDHVLARYNGVDPIVDPSAFDEKAPQVITLAECSLGDHVFADIGEQAGGPKAWLKWEVLAIPERELPKSSAHQTPCPDAWEETTSEKWDERGDAWPEDA